MRAFRQFRGRRSDLLASRAGFTLIELLVVVAIIAVLAAMLMSALAGAKWRADSAVCKSNLHQWGLVTQMYLADCRAYPPYGVDDTGSGPTYWSERLERYIRTTPKPWTPRDAMAGSVVPKGVEICPGYARLVKKAVWSSGTVASYGYNRWGCAWPTTLTEKTQLGLGGVEARSAGPPDYYLHAGDVRCIGESEVTNPSDMIAIGDVPLYAGSTNTSTDFVAMDWFPGSGVLLYGVALELGTGAGLLPNYNSPQAKLSITGMRRRHGGRWNLVFCDAHVESLMTAEVFDGRRSEVTKRWNRDNLPHPENAPPLLR